MLQDRSNAACVVQIKGLSASPRLNGLKAIVARIGEDSADVKLITVDTSIVTIPFANLVLVPPGDRA